MVVTGIACDKSVAGGPSRKLQSCMDPLSKSMPGMVSSLYTISPGSLVAYLLRIRLLLVAYIIIISSILTRSQSLMMHMIMYLHKHS